MAEKSVVYYEAIIGTVKVGEPVEIVTPVYGSYVTRDVVSYDEQTEVFETDWTVYVPA